MIRSAGRISSSGVALHVLGEIRDLLALRISTDSVMARVRCHFPAVAPGVEVQVPRRTSYPLRMSTRSRK